MKEWITGRNPVYETLRAGRRHAFRLLLQRGVRVEGRLQQALEIAQKKRATIEEVSRERLDGIYVNHQGIALEASAYPYVALDDLLVFARSQTEPPFFLLLDLIQDPQNLGTLLRTAETFGVHGVVIPTAHSALITPAVVNASSGASDHLLIAQSNLAQAIDRIKTQDAWVIGLDEDPRSQEPSQINLNMGVAIVVGNEGSGLRDLVRKKCDVLMRLPMTGKIESLNAAVAGSIALYLARSARK